MDLDLAFRRLRRRANKLGLRVRFKTNTRFRLNAPGTVASYHPPTRTVSIIKKKWSKRDLVYTLAHEIGHAIDFDKEPTRKLPLHSKALTLFHMYARGEVRLHPKHKADFRKYIIGLETAAFDEGDKLLEELGITLSPDWMWSQRRGTLGAYRRIFSRRT